MLTYIPDLAEILNGWTEELGETVNKMKAYSAVGSGSAFSN